jgi:cysteine desulfurase/selenocysteine lyase
MTKIGLDKIEEHERKLNNRLTRALCGIKEISIIGPRDPALRGGIYSFNIRTVQPHDAAMILDEAANIMVRSGMLCVHSWFNAHKIKGCIRASFYFYNTEAEIDLLASQIKKLVKDFCK